MPWKVEPYVNEQRIELTNGMTSITVPFAEGQKLGRALLKACTNSSQVATAPSGKGKGGAGTKSKKTTSRK
jgi:hypothetical protein